MEGTVRSITEPFTSSSTGRTAVTVEVYVAFHEVVIFNTRPGKYQIGDKVEVKYAGTSREDGYALAHPEDEQY